MNKYARHNSQGFTLIEVLVVTLILGIAVAVLFTSVTAGGQSKELDNEASRLFGVLRMASDEAVFTNTEIGILIEENEYSFLEYDEDSGKWEGATQSFLRDYTLPEWIEISYSREGEELSLKRRKKDDDSLQPDTGPDTSKTPDIWLLSSGDLTPFDITLVAEDDRDRPRIIKTDENGEIVLVPAGEDS